MTNMKLLLVAAVGLAALLVDSSDALFLGQGGVFNSKEAQQSFNSRFVQSMSVMVMLVTVGYSNTTALARTIDNCTG